MSKIRLKKKYSHLFTDELSRYFILTGGRGSSKSFSVNTFLLLLSFERGHKILFTRYTMKSAEISIIPEFLEKIQTLGLEDQFSITKESITNNDSGSQIIFRGIKTSSGDQTAALKSIQGITTWVLDEAEELTNEEIFDKIDLSVREKGKQNRVILILNPATKAHWIYSRFFAGNGIKEGSNTQKDNVRFIHTTYLDNIKNLDSSFISQVEKMKVRRPEKYQHQILGGWLDKAEGVIFRNWEFGRFPEQNENLNTVYGLDFGYSFDPTALVKVAIDSKRKRIYLKQLLYTPELSTSDISEVLSQRAKNGLIIGDSAEGRLIDELRAKGHAVKKCKKGGGSVNEGIFLMQDYDLIIDEGSEDLANELNNYTWIENKIKAIDKYNHLIDAARYAITHVISKPNKGKYSVM